MGSTSSPPSTNGITTNGINTSNHAAYSDTSSSTPRPIVLHLGAQIHHNPDIYSRFASQFHVVRPEPAQLERRSFVANLKNRIWGNFSAIIKPFWSTGGEMNLWDRELIDLLPDSMRVMAGAGAGFDWVDTDALSERGILYCNGAGASTESVTNYALIHLISVFTHFPSSARAAHSLSPESFQIAHTEIPLTSHNPSNHTLGIVGLGNIGFRVAKKVRAALEMRIVYHDIYRKPAELEGEIDAEFYSNLHDMLPWVDCLLLATPSGSPIITKQTLALLPQGARVVNIARGSLVDEDALADALDSGHISAAGLDVHKNEPKVNERLARMKNVLLTCHTGGASVETNVGFERLVMENVELVLGGEEALTAVNAKEVARWRDPRQRDGHSALKVAQQMVNGSDGLVNGHVYPDEMTNGKVCV